jgi:bifunctional non-homologous end joining protein LigD
VYVPLNTPVSYGQTKPFARAVAELLAQRHPKLVVSRMSTRLRAGKVLIDWSQNDPHKTTVCVYSLRAAEQPVVSTPLAWEEVQRAARRRSEPQLSLSPQDLLARVAREGDLFAALVDLRQELPDLARPR